MSVREIVYFIIALLVMLVGLAGVILPVLPGAPFIFGAAFLYAVLTGFAAIGAKTLIILGILTAISLLLDWLSSTYGVKKSGGSTLGMLGSMVGMVVGLVIPGVGLVGFIVGAFIGAFLGEILAGKKYQQAARAGLGSLLGLILGGVVKFALAAVMIGIFIWQVLF